MQLQNIQSKSGHGNQSDTDIVFDEQSLQAGLELQELNSLGGGEDLFIRIQGLTSNVVKNKELLDAKRLKLEEYSDKIGEIGAEYETFNKTEEKDGNKEQSEIMLKQKIDTLEKQVLTLGLSGAGGISNGSSDGISQNVNKNDWRLGVSGYSTNIINFGKTFVAEKTSLARTGGDLPMCNKTGIYSIEWNVEELSNYQRNNGIGICTDFYKSGFLHSQEDWICQSFHIGWDFGGLWNSDYGPNGLLCGWYCKESNIFYKKCKFIGDPLPIVTIKDKVGLIYDSNNNILYFKKNGEPLNSKLINIPDNYDLYWFAAKENYKVKMSIISVKGNSNAY